MTKKLTFKEKVAKYYKEHPYFETYKDWKIRLHRVDHRYLGAKWYYTCDVRVGVESCEATDIEMLHEWIDQKIKEGKVQQEDI